MPSIVLAELTASISEFKKNPMATVNAGEGSAVAILNHNEPAFYCVPPALYAAMMEQIENAALNAIADERLADGDAVFVEADLDAIIGKGSG